MANSLKVKLRTAALSFSGLTALLGGSELQPSLFRWYDTQLSVNRNGAGAGTWPAVVVTIVSNPNTYTFTGRMPTGWTRVQFLIWSTDPEVNETVLTQLKAFLEQFWQGTGIEGNVAYPNQVANEVDGLLPDANPPQYQKTVDVRIFNNDSV